MIPFREALALVLASAHPTEPEEVALEDALGRVLAEPISGRRAVPPQDWSARDGWAVRSADLRGASAGQGVALRAVAGSHAGGPRPEPLQPGTAARVLTGAPLPPGADAVVMQEEAALDGDRVRISGPVRPGDHVRPRGSELAVGREVLPAGARVGPAQLALLAAAGCARVAVRRRPRVGILGTGDELGTLEDAAPEGLVDSSAWGLRARVLLSGGLPRRLGIARDHRASIAEKLAADPACDVLLTTGGTASGDRDFVRSALSDLGVALRCEGVAMRPGRTTAFGFRDRKLFFALPGGPGGAALAFEVLVRPALHAMLGLLQADPLRPSATLAEALPAPGPVTAFVECRLTSGPSGLLATPLRRGQGPSPAAAQGLVVQEPGSDALPRGGAVQVQLLEAGLL